MTLDCQTPVGRTFLRHEDETVRRVAELFNCTPVRLGGLATSTDRLFMRQDQLVGVAEIKTRQMGLHDLERFGSYLITEKKLLDGAALSKQLHIPYAVVVRLLRDDTIVCWRVTDATGQPVLRWQTQRTETQRSCNGGTALRDNAYLPLTAMRRF